MKNSKNNYSLGKNRKETKENSDFNLWVDNFKKKVLYNLHLAKKNKSTIFPSNYLLSNIFNFF